MKSKMQLPSATPEQPSAIRQSLKSALGALDEGPKIRITVPPQVNEAPVLLDRLLGPAEPFEDLCLP